MGINRRGISQGHFVVSPDRLFPSPSTSSFMKATENINQVADDLKQHMKEISIRYNPEQRH
jgi:hypothetical protein